MPEFSHSGPISFEISVYAGSVKVIAEQRHSVDVEVKPQNDSQSNQDFVEATTVQFEDGKLLVEVPEMVNKWHDRARGIEVEARVPADSVGWINAASADVQCEGTLGSVRTNTASGDVTIGPVNGDAGINTASGDIRIGAVGGNLNVNSASGDVAAESVGGSVTTRTVSGDVKIGSVAGNVEVESVSGDIFIDGLDSGEAFTRTVSGDVRLNVVKGTGVWLDLNSKSGDIVNRLDPDEDPSERHKLSVHARSLSGDIVVSRAAAAASAN